MRNVFYLISYKIVGAKRWHILKIRETNLRRARKTLNDLLKGNKRYVIGRIEKTDSSEEQLDTVYEVAYKSGKRS